MQHSSALAFGNAQIHVLESNTTQVLLTRLRDERTDAATATAAVDRLKRILLEEALASFGTKCLEPSKAPAQVVPPVSYMQDVCAIAVCHDHAPSLLEEFVHMEPSAAYGAIHLEIGNQDAAWSVTSVQLPTGYPHSNIVLLQAACIDVALVCNVLQALQAHGIDMANVCLASLVCTAPALAAISAVSAELKVVTTAVIEDPPLSSFLLLTRLG